MRKSSLVSSLVSSVFFITFVLLLAIALNLPSQTESQSIKATAEIGKDIKTGINYAKRKEFKSAQDSFEAVLRKDPKNSSAYNNLANIDLLMGKYGSAMQKYWKALLYNESDTNIFLNLGIVYYLQMDITDDKNYTENKDCKIAKEDWKSNSEEAFSKAFADIKSIAEACYVLGIPRAEAPEYAWIQKLLREAADQANKPSGLRVGGSRSRNEWKIPVYWKMD